MSDTARTTGFARPWVTVFALIFVLSWSGNQFTPLLLLYKSEQHYSSLVVNAFLGIYVLGLAPSLLLAGALSDRYGRRPLMLVGVVAAICASGSLAFSSLGSGPLYLGRFLAGIAVGVAMAVGTSWMKEVSQAPHDRAADFGAGARRASLAFTLGSGSGALVAGAIAQWTPFGEFLPFLINVALALPLLWLVLRVPETSVSGGVQGSLREQFRIPAASHKRFIRVVVVIAPWLFVAASIGYGYVPVLLSAPSEGFGVAYATLLCVIMLGTSALIQPVAKRLDSVSSARSLLIGFGLIVIGLLGAAFVDATQSLALGIVAAFVLGAGFGIGLLSSLLEVQRIATPKDLAGLTGLFYAISYVGFLTPAILSAITPPFTTVVLLVALAACAVIGCLLVVVSNRKHLPGAAG
ncbi:MFS transporter [Glaciihabitans sp. dw_435]|uniref:MFS transporter n=1 Tax=Glaciihabitans sp. dw_435 TaxID=2720081 RepID=UPI001BD47190|nr:MFS transporter [Glaciihabitans sp. dw_435]